MRALKPFSVQTIHALAEAVTGGSASNNSTPIGFYRSGPKLERFFGALNIELRIGNGSRVPTVIDALTRENKLRPEAIVRVFEAVADPRDFLNEPEKHAAVVEYLNKRLKYDGYELRANATIAGPRVRIGAVSGLRIGADSGIETATRARVKLGAAGDRWRRAGFFGASCAGIEDAEPGELTRPFAQVQRGLPAA